MSLLRWFLVVSMLLTVSACGVRPERLDPPADADPAAYPRTYPKVP